MQPTIHLSGIDIHFADFICRIDSGASNPLWWGAALASCFAGEGHSCFSLNEELNPATFALSARPPLTQEEIKRWRELLLASESVGRPGDSTPLVLDETSRLYLHRCWSYERKVADGIISRSAPTAWEFPLDPLLDRYFPESAADPLQRTAAVMALTRRFSVISGGPGTGKTSTVARILALMLETESGKLPAITLAAPTGKAALRLQSAIKSAVENLPMPLSVKNSFPKEVTTIHRLLGAGGRSGEFRQNRRNPLICDILIIDEASMVDLRLMAAIFSALPDEARLLLLGDRNQLASVEAGAVLADICRSARESTLPVTNLIRSFRFDERSGIAALSRLVNRGDGKEGVELLKSGLYPDIVWRELPKGRAFEAAFTDAAREGFRDFSHSSSPEEAISRINDFKVLTPLREGEYGAVNLNRICRNAVARQKRGSAGDLLQLLITVNNYELNLFNGDTGVAMTEDGRELVWFEGVESEVRQFARFRMPPHEEAFALTVHKSQGSEFERVLLVMPDYLPGVLCRELLYTAITRARSGIEIWGCEEVFIQSIERQTVRKSGLADRLKSEA